MANKYKNQMPQHLIKLRALIANDRSSGRLNFPLERLNQKKHFNNQNCKDQVQLGLQARLKIIKRNYLDTSDIEGSQPKKWSRERSEQLLGIINQQKRDANQAIFNNSKSKRQMSQIKISHVVELPKINPQLQYDRLQKGGKKLRTEPSRDDFIRQSVLQKCEGRYGQGKRTPLLYNPTYLSGIFFA